MARQIQWLRCQHPVAWWCKVATWEKGERYTAQVQKGHNLQWATSQWWCRYRDLRWILKTLTMTNEAIFRQARPPSTSGDIRTTASLLHKLARRIHHASASLPDLRQSWNEGLYAVRDALTIIASSRKDSLRAARIKEWKDKIKTNSKSTAVSPVVYHYLRKKAQKHPANLLEDQDGNIITDPSSALSAFANKWDEVFSANILLPREEQVLAPIIPLIETVRRDVHLPPLVATDLFHQAQARRSNAAGGMDGWTTKELQGLHHSPSSRLQSCSSASKQDYWSFPLKLALDEGHACDKGLIGMKLDKSKCFDRLTPRISALLMLAFGLPLSLVRVFLGLYSSASRVVCYNRWSLPTPITTSSGVFQGCSLSLLCINLHMAVWGVDVEERTRHQTLCIHWRQLYHWHQWSHSSVTISSWPYQDVGWANRPGS